MCGRYEDLWDVLTFAMITVLILLGILCVIFVQAFLALQRAFEREAEAHTEQKQVAAAFCSGSVHVR